MQGNGERFLCFAWRELQCFFPPVDRAPLHVGDVAEASAAVIPEQDCALPIAFCGLQELRHLRRGERVAFFCVLAQVFERGAGVLVGDVLAKGCVKRRAYDFDA